MRAKPKKAGYLSVGDGHRVYYQVYGNLKGTPVLFLHGGPGAGCSKTDLEFFDLKFYQVILLDQRGAGQSKPFAGIKANTSKHLVDDIDKLLNKLKLDRVILFGGSWGSTLSLLYAIKNPDRVLSMVLRGIYLSRKCDNAHFLKGGIKSFFPEVWERFIRHVPKAHRKDPVGFYYRKMKSKDKSVRDFFAYEWTYYEISLATLQGGLDIEKLLEMYDYRSIGTIEAHFIHNNCFMPENYILKNTKVIEHIPTVIVQGRYDMICPPEQAVLLSEKLNSCQLHLVCAGHSSHEKQIFAKLRSEMKRLQKEYT